MNEAVAAFVAVPEAVVLGLIATGAGRRLCTVRLPDATGLERSVLGFPVGMGLLSLFTTALLFLRIPGTGLPWILAAVLLSGAVWARRDVLDLLRELRAFVSEWPWLSAAIAASALLGVIGCLAPETGWDTGVYHFTLARLRAEQGGMLVRLDVPHGYRPAYMEALYTLGFALQGETLASLINASFYLAGLALTRLWGVSLGGPRGGLFAALAWMTSATYVLRYDGGDVEVGQAVFLGTALYALIRLRQGAGSWRILAGSALGMLLGIKYASINIAIVIAALWLVLRLKDRSGWKPLLLDGFVIGGLGLAIACPWYVRNRIAVGSLFFPYGASVGAGQGLDLGVLSAGGGHAMLKALGMDVFILAGLAALPVAANARARWTAALPILTGLWTLRQLGFTAPAVSNAMRYAAPTWLPLMVLGGVGVSEAVAKGGFRRLAALVALAGPLALGQGVLAVRNLPKAPVALGLVRRDAYLEGKVSTWRAIRDAEAALPAGKKILLVEERSYYCRAPFLAAWDVPSAVDFDAMKTAADLRAFLDREAVGAIVVDREGGSKIWKFRNLEVRLADTWPPPGVRPLPVSGQASLYRVD